jgi:hypothetical protein
MKVLLEFDLPDEQDKSDACMRGAEWKAIAQMLQFEISSLRRNGHPYTTADAVLKYLEEKLNHDLQYLHLST